jgi:hypothetical protein
MVSPDAKFLVLADKYNQLKNTLFAELEALKQTHDVITKQEGPQGPAGKDGPKGRDGKDGRDGVNGKDGRDGVDGVNGKDGKDGVSIVEVNVDIDNSLIVKLSDGNIIDAGQIEVSSAQKSAIYSTGFGSQVVETPVYAVRYDEIDSSTAYRGEAAPNSSEDDLVWRIQKIVINNNDVTITWAGGSTVFNKRWTDRLSYIYS